MTERSIFFAALEIEDPAARRSFLDEACRADPALRARVDALLAADEEVRTFMDRSPAATPFDLEDGDLAGSTSSGPIDGATGMTLADRYLVGEEIGRGGMGTVYRADQLRPVRREVAVKLVNPGMDSRSVLARFEAERQALAVMDHPHIAKVLDAGATPDGRPFFVMELVRGVSLTDYCDARHLPMAGRLALFRQVCGAVQHAHQKGVIHRDLKPSNILVEDHDGTPVPKVIDFGLAKAVGGVPLTDQTLFTAPGSAAGTPLYMAPEQAGPDLRDVDTRADVYALGAVLYELLTGSPPISRETLRRAALHEVFRVIREDDPQPPSSRLGSSAELPTVAANRGTEPARLGRFVRGDLDWVVMKALEKDRGRRYESAAALGEDLERFLNHEPVAAGPPTLRYRARKFVRRHRPVVVAAGLVLSALVAGVAGTTWGMVRAEAQRARAEEATARSYRALETLAEDALEGLIGRRADWGDRELAFLGRFRDQFEQLTAVGGGSPAAQLRRAAARARLGSIRSMLGDIAGAESDLRAAAEEYGRIDGPEARRGAAEARRRLGQLLATNARPTEAAAELRAAVVAFDRLAADSPADKRDRLHAALVRNDSGFIQLRAGAFAGAEADLRAAAATLARLSADDPTDPVYPTERARALNNLHGVLSQTGRRDEAGHLIDEVVTLLRSAATGRRDPKIRQQLGRALTSAAASREAGGRLDEAEPLMREALAVHARLVEDFPAVHEHRADLGLGQSNLALMYQKAGRPVEAEASFRDAIANFRRLADAFPDMLEYRLRLAMTLKALSAHLDFVRRPPEAEALLLEALPLWERLRADAPSSPASLTGLIYTLACLGKAANLRNQNDQAGSHLERAEAERVRSPGLLARDPDGADAGRLLDRFVARRLVDLGRHAEAAARADRLAAISDPDGASNAFNAACYLARCSSLAAADQTLPADGRRALADQYGARAVEHLRSAAARGFADRVLFATDPDLAPLLGRPDYKDFLAGLR